MALTIILFYILFVLWKLDDPLYYGYLMVRDKLNAEQEVLADRQFKEQFHCSDEHQTE